MVDTQFLIESFYYNVWNRADEDLARRLLTPDFRFRGSLGEEKISPEGFIEYMRMIHQALGNYECLIEDLITNDNRAATQMRFRGIHQNTFMGAAPTGRKIEWAGAAFFTISNDKIAKLWVLGDIYTLSEQLKV